MGVIANTLSDFRGNTREKPVWKSVVDQMSWADNETNEDTSVINVGGIITSIVVTYSAAAANMTLAIQDSEGNELYTTTDVDGATYVKAADGSEFGQNQLAGTGFILSVTATDPGGSGVTADVTIYGV